MKQRTVLFKAQLIKDNSWMSGDYFYNLTEDKHIITGIIHFPGNMDEPPHDLQIFGNIIPETLCQHCEHKDIKNILLFHHDKVKATFPLGWYDDNFNIDEDKTLELEITWSGGWFLTDPFNDEISIFMESLDTMDVKLEVIGNTHDKNSN